MSQDGGNRDIGKILLPAVRGKMGEREYILCVMPVREAVKRIKLAGEITTSKQLSEMLQRDIDDRRIQPLVDYLRGNDRFFNALVVAMCGGDARWRGFTSLKGVENHDKNKIGFLSLSGEERMYALDGQHRLMGFKEAVRQNQPASNDEIGLLIVHHDEGHETGKKRSRQLFIALNKYVEKADKSSIIALDEKDTAAIVVRELVENRRYADFFQLKKRIYLSSGNKFDSTSTGCFTTIGMLYDCVKNLLKSVNVEEKENLIDDSPLREEAIASMASMVYQYFQAIAGNITEVNRYFSEKEAKRLKEITKNSSKRNILFRPLGLKCLIDVVCVHSKKEDININKSIEICSKNLPFEMSEKPIFGLVWNGNKINNKGFLILKNIYLHMLGLLTLPKSREVEKKYRDFLENKKASLPPQIRRK